MILAGPNKSLCLTVGTSNRATLTVAKRQVHFLDIRPWGSICSCIERASSSRVKSSTMHNSPLSPQMGLPGVGGLVSQQQLFARPPMMAGLPGQQGKPPPDPPY